MFTERDIFFSIHPKIPLLLHSRDELEAAFGPSDRSQDLSIYIDELISDIYKKYRRIDLIKWDPEPDTAFFDFVTQSIISIDQLNRNFNKYSPMALQRLQAQLDITLKRWGKCPSCDEFHKLFNRINNRLQMILSSQAIVE
jgi:hypothetical protein